MPILPHERGVLAVGMRPRGPLVGPQARVALMSTAFTIDVATKLLGTCFHGAVQLNQQDEENMEIVIGTDGHHGSMIKVRESVLRAAN